MNYMVSEINRLYALSEPRIKDWVLINNPWCSLSIVAIYLYVIFKAGPDFMKNRKPYNLKKVIILYNILQIILNLILAYKAYLLGWLWKYKFACEPINYSNSPNDMQVLNIMWYYYILKIFDLIDTIFFVLRKKQNQITFLHVYHHGGMVILVYLAINMAPGGHGTLLGLVNGIVHVFMYSYYLSTLLNYNTLRWKKHITQLQILQFLILTLQHSVAIFKEDCNFPKVPIYLVYPFTILMTYLFINFYIKNYVYIKSSKNDWKEVNVNNINDNNHKSLSNEKLKTR